MNRMRKNPKVFPNVHKGSSKTPSASPTTRRQPNHKSKTNKVQKHSLDILNWNIGTRPSKYDILLSHAHQFGMICIQENQKLNDSPIDYPRHFKRYLPSPNYTTVRSMILVNTNIVHQYGITQVFPDQIQDSSDITVLFSSLLNTYFINIYNAKKLASTNTPTIFS